MPEYRCTWQYVDWISSQRTDSMIGFMVQNRYTFDQEHSAQTRKKSIITLALHGHPTLTMSLVVGKDNSEGKSRSTNEGSGGGMGGTDRTGWVRSAVSGDPARECHNDPRGRREPCPQGSIQCCDVQIGDNKEMVCSEEDHLRLQHTVSNAGAASATRPGSARGVGSQDGGVLSPATAVDPGIEKGHWLTVLQRWRGDRLGRQDTRPKLGGRGTDRVLAFSLFA